MKNSVKFEKAFEYFKKSYSYKMGGTQTVVLPNGKSKSFDDREYYSGRGAKYNSSIKHDIIGEVKVSRKEYSAFLKLLKEREERRQKMLKKAYRVEDASKRGVYTFEGNTNSEKGAYVELSAQEEEKKVFDIERLAETLNIKVSDVELLKSIGKTYVFAKSYCGEIYQLYHPSLDVNHLSIHVKVVTLEDVAKFNHEEWASKPFAKKLGQTASQNHFVC